MTEKVRENRLRRKAKRLGLWLKKSRAKVWSIHNQQGYMILDPYRNTILWGPDFGLTLDQVEYDLDGYEAELRKEENDSERLGTHE